MKQSTLEAQKIEALETYKNAKKRYLETLSQSDWIAFCNAKRNCMLLGVRI